MKLGVSFYVRLAKDISTFIWDVVVMRDLKTGKVHPSAGLASHISSEGDCEHHLCSVIQDGDAVTSAE